MKEYIFIIERSIVDKVNASESETFIKFIFVRSLALQKCGTFREWKFMQIQAIFHQAFDIVNIDFLSSPGIFQFT